MERTYNRKLRSTLLIFILIPFIIASFFLMGFCIRNVYKSTDRKLSECTDKFVDKINEYAGTSMQRIKFVNYYSSINACLMNTEKFIIDREIIDTNNKINDVIGAMLANNDLSELCIFTNNPNAIPISIVRIEDDDFFAGLNIPDNDIVWMLDGTDTQAGLCVYKKFSLVPGYENVIRIRIPVKQILKSFSSSSFDKLWVDFELYSGGGVSFGVEGGKLTSGPLGEAVYKNDFELSAINGKVSVSVERKYISVQILKLLIIYFATVLLLLGAAFAVSKVASERITRELNSIIASLSGSSVDDIKSINVKNKEFKIIRKYLMDLTDEIKRENDEKIELQTEMLNLRITPHFIYNNLSAIKSTSSDRFTRLAVDKFVKYCRNIFSNRNKFIKVKDEIRNSCEYLELLQFCYAFEFDVITDIDEECEDMILPVNILQPVLENAFIHGINCMPDDFCGVIEIEAKTDGEYLYIRVSDNAGRLNTNNNANEHHALDILQQLLDMYYKNSECCIKLEGDKKKTTAEIKVEAEFGKR